MQSGESSDEAIRFAAEYLDPDRIRTVIIHIGLFILSFEQLRHLVIDKPRLYYSDDLKIVDGEIRGLPTDLYKEAVINLGTKEDRVFGSSLKFLVKHCAISESDESDIIALLDYRNLIAHEPHKILDIQGISYQSDAVDRVTKHHRNIGKFWALAEAETDPDFTGGEPINGATLLLDYMIAAAAGAGDRPPAE